MARLPIPVRVCPNCDTSPLIDVTKVFCEKCGIHAVRGESDVEEAYQKWNHLVLEAIGRSEKINEPEPDYKVGDKVRFDMTLEGVIESIKDQTVIIKDASNYVWTRKLSDINRLIP